MSRPRILFVFICLVLACGFSASADTIRACVSSNGSLRIVLPGEPCKSSEFAISWNSDDGGANCEEPAPSIVGTIQFGNGAANPIYGLEDGVVSLAITLGGGGGGSVGKPELEPISVLQMASSETAERFGNVVTGTHIPVVEIDVFDAAGGLSVQIQLEDVIVVGFALVPGAGPDRPFNRISLDYTRIIVSAGGVTRCYNKATNSPSCS